MQRRIQWNCESIKITKNEITETEFNEKLERVWDLLQPHDRQLIRFFRPDRKNEFVEDAIQTYRRSA